MLMQKSGATTEYLFLMAIAITAGTRIAAAQHALETFAILEIKNGARMNYGQAALKHNTAPGAAILTTAALYAKAIFATETIRDGAQTSHGPL